MYTWITPAAILIVSAGLAGSAWAQPVPGAGVAKEVLHAGELPDPNATYKVLFDVAKAAPKPEQLNPMLDALARM